MIRKLIDKIWPREVIVKEVVREVIPEYISHMATPRGALNHFYFKIFYAGKWWVPVLFPSSGMLFTIATFQTHMPRNLDAELYHLQLHQDDYEPLDARKLPFFIHEDGNYALYQLWSWAINNDMVPTKRIHEVLQMQDLYDKQPRPHKDLIRERCLSLLRYNQRNPDGFNPFID